MKSENFYILIFMGLGILILAFLIIPNYQHLKVTRGVLKELRESLQQKENYFQQLREIEERLKEFPEELSKIESALPSKPDPHYVLNYIQEKAAQNQLIIEKVTDLSVISLPNPQKLKQIKINLTLLGELPFFENFLKEVEKSSRLIDFEQISISKGKGEKELKFELKIKVHSY